MHVIVLRNPYALLNMGQQLQRFGPRAFRPMARIPPEQRSRPLVAFPLAGAAPQPRPKPSGLPPRSRPGGSARRAGFWVEEVYFPGKGRKWLVHDPDSYYKMYFVNRPPRRIPREVDVAWSILHQYHEIWKPVGGELKPVIEIPRGVLPYVLQGVSLSRVKRQLGLWGVVLEVV